MYNIDPKTIDSEEQKFSYSDLSDILSLGEKPPSGFKERITPFHTMENAGQTIHFIRIPRNRLCKSIYQRNMNQKTIEGMKGKDFYQALGGIVNVHESFLEVEDSEKLWFYSVFDGQHRVYTNPADEVIGIVSNTIPESLAFVIANDKSSKTSATDEDLFHAKKFISGTIEYHISKMIKESFDIEIERHIDHASGKKKSQKTTETCYEWGAVLLQLYKEIEKKVKSYHTKPKKVINEETGKVETVQYCSLSDDEIKSYSIQILESIVQLVVSVFGLNNLKQGKGSKNQTQWIKHIGKWIIKKFSPVSIPFDSIKEAFELKKYASSKRNNAVITQIAECSLEYYNKHATTLKIDGFSATAQKLEFLNRVWYAYNLSLN